MNISYDQAADEATEALEEGMDINDAPSAGESPDDAEDAGSQEEQESGQDGDQQPTQHTDDFNPQSWTLKFRGKEIQPKDRQHLINLAQQGYLYNNKAQELKTREQQLEQMGQQYAKYKQLAEAFQKNPQLQQQIMALYHKSMGQQQQGENEQASQGMPPQLHPYLEKIDTLEQRLQKMDQQQADEELRREINDLKSRYQEDWDTKDENGHSLMWELLNHAHKNNFKTLEQAYRDMMWDTMMTRTKSEALKKQAEDRKKKAKQGIVTPDGGQRPPSGNNQPDFRKMSYNDIAEHVIANELKQ